MAKPPVTKKDKSDPAPVGERPRADELSGLWGEAITRDMVRGWRRRGFPTGDNDALLIAIATAPRAPAWAVIKAATLEGGGGELDPVRMKLELLAATLRKTEAEADLKETQATAEKEKWKTAAEVEDLMRTVGALTKSFFLQLETTLAPAVEGLPLTKSRPIFRAHARKVLDELHRLALELAAEKEQDSGP